MKSIMEEASSIAKAIEKGWERAGKPQEFSVKVYEESEKNFLGMTKKPAKIGLFFQETTARHNGSSNKHQEKPGHQPKKGNAHPQAQQQPARQHHTKQQHPRVELEAKEPRKEHTSSSPWSTELEGSAVEWIKDSLRLMDAERTTFSVEVDRYALKIKFDTSVTQNPDKEKLLFRSWAYLIMQALRQKYKRPLKGLKVILMSHA